MAAEFQVGPKTPDFALFAARIREAGGRVSVLEHDDTSHIKIILSFAALFRGRDTVYEDTIGFLKSL